MVCMLLIGKTAGFGSSENPAGRGSRPVLREHQVQSDADRVRLIFGQIHKGLRDPETRGRSMSLTSSCRSRDDLCELGKLFTAGQKRLRYVADPRGIDTYQTPQRTWAWGGGDCDDHTALHVAHAVSIGFRGGVRLVAPDGGEMVHIIPIVGVPKENPTRVVALDTTVEGATLGWLPKMGPSGRSRDYWYEEDDNGRVQMLAGDVHEPGRMRWIVAGLLVVAGIGVAVWYSRRGTR